MHTWLDDIEKKRFWLKIPESKQWKRIESATVYSWMWIFNLFIEALLYFLSLSFFRHFETSKLNKVQNETYYFLLLVYVYNISYHYGNGSWFQFSKLNTCKCYLMFFLKHIKWFFLWFVDGISNLATETEHSLR